MAEADPRIPQVVDPELTVDLTRLLQIRGPLGVLNVLDTIVPVVSLGNVVTPDINVRGPTFRSTDVFSIGRLGAPAAGTVLADTGALPAGIYDVMTLMTIQETINNFIRFSHRNAANTADLMTYDPSIGLDARSQGFDRLVFSYELAINERLRFTTVGASAVGSMYAAVIFARIR